MTLRQTIQAAPAKATELIAKLADTSNHAVKTRENLFARLKDELEQYADIEERHLLPILRKHPETKGLAPEATNANRELRRQLSELDRLPKGDERFIEQLAALKNGLQRHVRDERKEILPAILKALSQEEAEQVAGRIETAVTESKQAKRDQEEKERQEAQRAREQQAANERVAEEARAATQHTADAVADMARSSTGTMQEAAQSGMQMATQMTERSLDQFRRMLGFPGRETEETTQQAARNIQAVVDCSVVLANGFQNVSREWLEQTQDHLRKNLDGFNSLLRARTPQDAIVAQSDLARRNLESLLAGTRRISELMVGMADQAADRITSAAEAKPGRSRDHSDTTAHSR